MWNPPGGKFAPRSWGFRFFRLLSSENRLQWLLATDQHGSLQFRLMVKSVQQLTDGEIVAMDLNELVVESGEILESEPANITQSLSELVAHENWTTMAFWYGEDTAERVRREMESQGKHEFREYLRRLAKEETDKLSREIKQVLNNASSFQVRGSLGDKLVELDKRAQNRKRKSDLLAVAFADALADLVFPAAERAAKLAELIVKDKPSREAEKYLQEACQCYFYGLNSASAVMCRSVLEEVIEKRIRALNTNHSIGTEHTLGMMLGLAERAELQSLRIVPLEALHAARVVNRLGSTAVHERPLLESEAWDCLTNARHALVCILK